jgi:DNA-binding IclR family transcriptional regulator
MGVRVGIRLSANEAKIVGRLLKSPGTTIARLAAQIGISKTSVQNILTKFKQTHLLRRDGSNRSGKWIIMSP